MRKNSSAEEVEVFLAEGSLDHPPLNPLSLHQDSVHQITKSPSQLNCSRFSPHAFHLDEKVEVFVAEGSPETLPLLPAPPPPVQEITNPHELRISTFWSSFTCPPSPLNNSFYLLQPWLKVERSKACRLTLPDAADILPWLQIFNGIFLQDSPRGRPERKKVTSCLTVLQGHFFTLRSNFQEAHSCSLSGT